jgi:hypothetical protein
MAALSRRAVGNEGSLLRTLSIESDPAFAMVSAVVGTVAIAVASGSATVLARRLSGGFALGPSAVLAWGVVAAGTALVAFIDAAVHTGVVGRWAGALTRAGVVVTVLALVPGGQPRGRFIAGLLALGVATTVALMPLRWTISRRWGATHDRAEPVRRGRSSPPATPSRRESAKASDAPLPDGFRQRFERFQSVEGSDRVMGRVLVDVAAGSRTGHAHLGFCPPFAAVPTVDVTSHDDGIEAIVSAAEVVPWGVRVECRLSEPAEEPLAIPVDVVARYPA